MDRSQGDIYICCVKYKKQKVGVVAAKCVGMRCTSCRNDGNYAVLFLYQETCLKKKRITGKTRELVSSHQDFCDEVQVAPAASSLIVKRFVL